MILIRCKVPSLSTLEINMEKHPGCFFYNSNGISLSFLEACVISFKYSIMHHRLEMFEKKEVALAKFLFCWNSKEGCKQNR